MLVNLWKNFGALNSKPVFEAFEKSVINAGDKISYDNVDGDLNVIWSVLWNGRMKNNQKIWEYCMKNKKPIVVLEVGGLIRNKTWKIGLNGINSNAKWSKNFDQNRPEKIGLKLKPWDDSGENIIICGQHSKSEQWKNMPPPRDWMENMIKSIREHTKKPIILRPHPRCPIPDISKNHNNVYFQKPNKIKKSYDDYDFSLKNVGAVFSHNSNPGVQSAILGTPVWTDKSSLAYPVSNSSVSNINKPHMPCRSEWLVEISHSEYFIDEISQGIPYERLTSLL